MTDTDRLRHMQTEVELSLDKVSIMYSPQFDGFTALHRPSRSFQEADCITYEALKQAIEGIGIRCFDDAAFPKLVGSIDRQVSHRVSFPQLDAAVHTLKLCSTSVVSADGGRLCFQCDLYEGHIILVFPVFRMESIYEKIVHMAKMRQKSRSKSLSSLFRLDSTTSPKAGPIPFRIRRNNIYCGNCNLITVKNGDSTNVWDELNHRLAIPYSKLRHKYAKFLLYAVLDVIVDRVTTVMDSTTEILITLEDKLDTLRQRFDITKLHCLKNELFRPPKQLKPARQVLKYLIESEDFDEVVIAYIRDVHDHMVQILDDIELQLQMCRLLAEGYRDQKSNQMNYVIHTLTISQQFSCLHNFLRSLSDEFYKYARAAYEIRLSNVLDFGVGNCGFFASRF
ncbi:unnamed protein product [Albugo candida]|uniref:Uncharacterized protein n=1 Tax=Albugo candida TaxID=65357 RepID=A0A024GPV0_9STRA|nr:unnamed protein product [Albugo candida]|eukprot:CCI48897.1 unnamed protein product [Albugo candida]